MHQHQAAYIKQMMNKWSFSRTEVKEDSSKGCFFAAKAVVSESISKDSKSSESAVILIGSSSLKFYFFFLLHGFQPSVVTL